MPKFRVVKQWRAVGACEFDVFHRDTKAEIGDDIVGEPEKLFSVVSGPEASGLVIADCYTHADARRVCQALNLLGEMAKVSAHDLAHDGLLSQLGRAARRAAQA